MDTTVLFLALGGIIMIGSAAEWLFKVTRIPDVLILILTGGLVKLILHVNPNDTRGFAAAFTSFALLYILFHGGLNLRLRDLLRNFMPSLLLTTLSFFATSFLGMILTLPLTGDVRISLFVGFLLGGTSSAVVIPLVRSLPIPERIRTMLMLESALSDVYSIIFSLSLMGFFSTGSILIEEVTRDILTNFAVAILLGMSIGLAWLKIIQKHPSLGESGMLTLAVMLILAGIVQSKYIQASSAITVLTFGIVLGNAKTAVSLFKQKTLPRGVLNRMDVYDELSFLIKTFFFTYLGILMSKPTLFEFSYALLLTLSFYAVRPLIVRLVQPMAKREEAIILDSLIPKGLAAAVLVTIAVQEGILSPLHPLVHIILWTIFMSILITSLLVLLAEQGVAKEAPGHHGKRIRHTQKHEAKTNAW